MVNSRSAILKLLLYTGSIKLKPGSAETILLRFFLTAIDKSNAQSKNKAVNKDFLSVCLLFIPNPPSPVTAVVLLFTFVMMFIFIIIISLEGRATCSGLWR